MRGVCAVWLQRGLQGYVSSREWTPAEKKNNSRDHNHRSNSSEVVRRLPRYLSSCARDESVNTVARLRCELWTANFVSDWIPERKGAKGRIRTTIRREIRERKKKGSAEVGERCLLTVPFLRQALGPNWEDTRSWYAVISIHYHARCRDRAATCIH